MTARRVIYKNSALMLFVNVVQHKSINLVRFYLYFMGASK